MAGLANNPRRRRLVFLAAGLAAATAMPASRATSIAAPAEGFDFALIGDLPYFSFETAVLRRLFDSLDPSIRFVVHVGDIKGGNDRCSDELLAARASLLDESPVPLLYTPGDNEWTDCSRPWAGAYDPLERLQWLRRRFFDRAMPLGRGAEAFAAQSGLTRQRDTSAAGLPENLQWRLAGARFVSINLPGSHNALGAGSASREEVAARNLQNTRWLEDAFARAGRSRDAVVFVAAHANPHFDRQAGSSSKPVRQDAYLDFRTTLLRLADGFAGETVLLHGDTHRHSIERLAPRLLRVESHGSPYSDRWVRISVRPGQTPLLTVHPVGIDTAQPMP